MPVLTLCPTAICPCRVGEFNLSISCWVSSITVRALNSASRLCLSVLLPSPTDTSRGEALRGVWGDLTDSMLLTLWSIHNGLHPSKWGSSRVSWASTNISSSSSSSTLFLFVAAALRKSCLAAATDAGLNSKKELCEEALWRVESSAHATEFLLISENSNKKVNISQCSITYSYMLWFVKNNKCFMIFLHYKSESQICKGDPRTCAFFYFLFFIIVRIVIMLTIFYVQKGCDFFLFFSKLKHLHVDYILCPKRLWFFFSFF